MEQMEVYKQRITNWFSEKRKMRAPLGNASRTRLAVFYLHWT